MIWKPEINPHVSGGFHGSGITLASGRAVLCNKGALEWAAVDKLAARGLGNRNPIKKFLKKKN